MIRLLGTIGRDGTHNNKLIALVKSVSRFNGVIWRDDELLGAAASS